MQSDTQSISIEAPPHKIAAFVSNPSNLPRWAVGFAKAVRHTDEGWVVETGSGDVPIRIVNDPDTGVIDFCFSPAAGAEALAASRVIRRGQHSEYVFTQFRPPTMSDEAFAKNVQTLTHELTVLKALMEVDCPL